MIYIRDNVTGKVREYGTSQHDSLRMSEDGKYLVYENLQNGTGTEYPEEGYSFVMEDGKTISEANYNPYDFGADIVNIGGFKKP
ncbi:MAG: hypothetical protein Q4B26_06740 [Eubacteriales bacterium]|nr:hypothetical protein [Eubacteriales bacterium]